ncbi:uncharacterized protein JN550_011587 [Neoarthrinium moseri]|uniref:uncharacterized protein n=1 Tax=Neoarthrinium moseri TaxID=1658444 RepID=UPI001FDB5618|nr:uncharacterized protein JN550_011587 [Neoarthrinium moseri]KAI1860321.1 hypothetical protein JN550_011587 [Neoarthrinium moseri]
MRDPTAGETGEMRHEPDKTLGATGPGFGGWPSSRALPIKPGPHPASQPVDAAPSPPAPININDDLIVSSRWKSKGCAVLAQTWTSEMHWSDGRAQEGQPPWIDSR